MERARAHLIKLLPFLLMAGGSGALFLANLYGRHILSPESYGSYSYLVTLASVVVTFGMWGLDQTLVRTGELKDGVLLLSRKTSVAALVALLVSSTVCTVVMAEKRMPHPILGGMFLTVVALTYLAYQFNRTRGFLASAQLLNNAWRVTLLVGLVVSGISAPGVRLQCATAVAVVLSGIIGLILVRRYSSAWRFDAGIPADAKVTLGFFATMVTAALLTYGDRFIVEQNLGVEELGRYFFLQNIFLFPLTMIATYTGFKEVHVFKADRTLRPIHRSLVIGVAISIAFSVLYVAAIAVLPVVPADLRLVCCLLVLLGMTRIPYASLSAAQSVHSSPRDLHLANLVSIVAFGVGLMLMAITGFSIEIIIISQIVAWLARLIYVYTRVRARLKLAGSIG